MHTTLTKPSPLGINFLKTVIAHTHTMLFTGGCITNTGTMHRTLTKSPLWVLLFQKPWLHQPTQCFFLGYLINRGIMHRNLQNSTHGKGNYNKHHNGPNPHHAFSLEDVYLIQEQCIETHRSFLLGEVPIITNTVTAYTHIMLFNRGCLFNRWTMHINFTPCFPLGTYLINKETMYRNK